MKISIVIPAHNEEKSVAKTILAALAQDYPDFEVIVIDNVSTDKTYEIASSFPVRVVKEPNKGLLHARERGRKEARGVIVANIDADCLPEPDWLSRGAIHFKNEKIAAVTGPYDYHDASPSFQRSSLMMQRYVYTFVDGLLQLPMIQAGAIMIGGNNMIRASIIEKMGGYNTDLEFYGEDMDTARRVAIHGKVLFRPDLIMKTSARRFQSQGFVGITGKYWFHFFKTIFGRRSKYTKHKKRK